MKTLAFLIVLFFAAPSSEHHPVAFPADDMIMCAEEEEDLPKCYGYANCNACSSCNYCKHCNSGGSCGVCAIPVKRRTYRPPAPKPSTSRPRTSTPTKKSNSSTTGRNTSATSDSKLYKGIKYTIIQPTSLRQKATHQSGVLLRFKTGDEVVLLEKTNQWWWKIQFKGRIGWVKKQLLQRKS